MSHLASKNTINKTTSIRSEGFSGNTFADNARVMIVHPNRAGSISSETVFDGNAENRVRVRSEDVV